MHKSKGTYLRRKYAIAAKYVVRCLFSELKKHFFYPRQKT